MSNRRILLYKARKSLKRQRVFRNRSNPFDFYNDFEFYQRYRFDKQSVLFLVNEFGESLKTESRRNFPVSPEIKILVTLRYLASHSLQQVVGDIFGLEKSTVCKIVNTVIPIIANSVDKFVKIPEGDGAKKQEEKFQEATGIPGIIGAIDCTHVKVPVGIEREYSFIDRQGNKSLNIQAACDFDYRFIHVYARWPGSCHDSFILQQSSLYADFEHGQKKGIFLGDSGYGNGKTWILTPFMNPQTGAEKDYNYKQKMARVKIEQAFGQLKRRWRGLLVGLRVVPEKAIKVTVAAFVLHNIAKDRNQPDKFTEDDDNDDDNNDEDDSNEAPFPGDASMYTTGKAFREHIVRKYFS